MINTIKNIMIAFNAYSYYFVKSFWITDEHHSEEYKIGSGLTILLIVNFAWISFANYQISFNWKATVFFVSCYHLLISLLQLFEMFRRSSRIKDKDGFEIRKNKYNDTKA